MSYVVNAVPKKIRFYKEGFCIMACDCKPSDFLNNSKYISVKGHVIGDPELLIGQDVEFSGEGLEHNQYGYTLAFDNYVVDESAGYFWTNISGVVKKAQNRIFQLYGEEPSWLDSENAKDLLVSVNGIGKKTAEKVLSRWDEYQGVRKIMEQLAPYGVSQKQVSAIHRHFKDNANKVIGENPYRLTEVKGFGFQKADSIALKIGVGERSDERFLAGIAYTLQERALSGHTMSSVEDVFKTINEIVLISDGLPVFESVDFMKSFLSDKNHRDFSFVDDFENWLSLSKYKYQENYISDTATSLALHPSKNLTMEMPEAVMALSEVNKGSFKLGEQQQDGLFKALTTPYMFAIAGYAGTGKSTVSKTLLNMLQKKFNFSSSDVVCCALSGVAANRIKQQSGYDGYTIHNLLGWEGKGFNFDEDNKLPHKVVLLDEAGMVDTWLMYSLFKAIDFSQTKLIMLGDPAQLSPVGAGQPFIDLLNKGLIKSIELTQIFRQSGDKAIPIVAQSIRNGVIPEILPSYSDVSFTKVFSDRSSERIAVNQDIMSRVLDLSSKNKWQKNLPKTDSELWDYITSFQVITPRRTGVLSQEVFNKEIRLRMLPSTNSPSVFKTNQPITYFDKIIHLRNENMATNESPDKKTRVYNGQMGVVTEVNTEEQSITVRYPLNGYSITYDESDLRNGLFGLAWCISIHKSQGAEFNTVVIPLTLSHYTMLNTRLFYTAVTRAKTKLEIVGESRAMQLSCSNIDSTQRDTVLGR